MRTTHINAPKKVAAPGELYNATYSQSDSTYLTNTEQVYDYTQEKSQEEFNIEVAQAITSLQNQETVDSYSKSEIDSKLGELNNSSVKTYVDNKVASEQQRASDQEQTLSNRITEVQSDLVNYVMKSDLDTTGASVVTFDGAVEHANINNAGTIESSENLKIYFINDIKTFGATSSQFLSPVPTLYLEWTGRETYAKNSEGSNLTTPYLNKIYVCNGNAYVWTGSQLKAVGANEFKAYYNNNEISSINITDTVSSETAYNSYIPSNMAINSLKQSLKEYTDEKISDTSTEVNGLLDYYYDKSEINSLLAALKERISNLENNSSSNNPSQGQVSDENTEIEDPTTDPGTTVTP